MMHALVVGGTGMLADVTSFLLHNGFYVSVIGRNRSKYEAIVGSTDSTFISVNYHEDQKLRSGLRRTVHQNGVFHIIVAWIHSSAPHAIQIILEEAAKTKDVFRFYHVVGSHANVKEIKESISVPVNGLYRQVQLGFIIEGERSRWLTNDEISTGVIAAIQEDAPLKIIGTLEPLEKRP